MLPAGDQDEVELEVPSHPGHQQATSSMLYTTSCKHSLVLLRMGENYLPKHVELIEVINKIVIVASSWLSILLFREFENLCDMNECN